MRHAGLSEVLLALSLVTNVALAWKLRSSATAVRQTPEPVALSNIHLVKSNGTPVTISFPSDKPVILYWFSPGCGWCELNWDNFLALARAVRATHYLLPVASDPAIDLDRFATARGWAFPVYHLDLDQAELLRLSSTPDTVLVDRNGVEVERWRGAFSPTLQRALRRRFDVRFPGLSVTPPGSR